MGKFGKLSSYVGSGRRLRGVLPRDIVGRLAVPLLLVIAVMVFTVTLPGLFLTQRNIVIMLTSNSVVLLLALGLTVPLRSGDFDLSIAAIMGFAAAVVGVLTTQHGVNPVLAGLIAVGLGAAIGGINALVVVGAGINAFIATLAILTMLGGLAFAVTGSRLIVQLPQSLQTFSRGKLVGVPASVWYGWAVAAILYYIYERTPFGRQLLFVGGNRHAARLSGIGVARVRSTSFVISGALSGFAGVVLAGNLGAVDPSIGPSYLLPPFAAAFLGTTMLTIGRFNVLGTMVGLYFITVVVTGLQLHGAQQWVANLFNGGILIAALLFAKGTERLWGATRRS